jgi:hypothetical protein
MSGYRTEAKSDKPHQQRVIEEANELGVKIDALSKFIIENPIFPTLPADEQERLRAQFSAMDVYFEILLARIDNF